MSRRLILFAPLALFALLVAALLWRLSSPPDPVIRSRLVGRPLPAFELAAAVPGKPGLASSDVGRGEPRLINLFASWCLPCIAEMKLLHELDRRGVAIDGIAIRDRPGDVAAFLAANGDPFERIGADPQSRVQIALGSSGVPESLVIDGRGIIRLHHVGPITRGDLPDLLEALGQGR